MKKGLRKVLSLFMIFIMVMSMLGNTAPEASDQNIDTGSVSTDSSGTPDSTASITVELTNDAGAVIGSMTTETQTTESDTPSVYSQQVDSSSQWQTSETEADTPSTCTEGDTTVETSGSVLTETEGQQSSTDNIHSNKVGGVQSYSGSGSGEETTDITNTETTVSTTEDSLLESSTEYPETSKDGQLQEGQWSTPETTGEGQWQQTGSQDGQWQQTGSKSQSSQTSGIDVDTDPLAKKDVTLEFNAPNSSRPSTDSEKIYIPIEDALENDISYTDGQIVDGYKVSLNRNPDGDLIGYTMTKYSNESGNKIDDQTIVPDKKDEELPEQNSSPMSVENSTPIDPDTNQPYTECVNEPIMENGVQIGVKTVVASTDPDTNITTYTVTKETWKDIPNSSTLPDKTPSDVPADSFTLPPEPVAEPTVTVGGLTTTTNVEPVYQNGQHVGYTKTVLVTDENGNEVSMESTTTYGTYTSNSSNIQRFPEFDRVTTTSVTIVYGTKNIQDFTKTNTGSKTVDNTRDVSQEIYQLVDTDKGLYFLYEGKMYKVQELKGHGELDFSSIKPNTKLYPTPSGDGKISEATDLRNPHYNDGVDVGSSTITSGYDYKYIGYGLESSITADTGGNGTLVHQFKLKDRDGNVFYALCADFNTSADRGADYSMENVWDADYYDDPTAKKISAIVSNGFWGTTEGIGSLASVIDFLKANSNLSDSLLEDLTPGEALTATQAAIWYYGNSGSSGVLGSKDATGKQYTGEKSGGSWAFKNADTDETRRINALYQALIGIDTSKVSDNSTELLSTNNFAQETKIVIKEKATDSNGNVETDSKGNEMYITDLSFSLDVKKNDLTGNLEIVITDENNKQLFKKKLSTSDSNLVGRILADGSAGSVYTIKDVKLPEGVKFDLTISGMQNLREGVYLYSAEVYSTSQTFVGIGSGSHDVNLSVSMEFSANDPSAKIKQTSASWSEEKTDKEFYSKTDSYSKERTNLSEHEQISVRTDTIGTLVRTDIVEEETSNHRKWSYNYFYQLITTKAEDGGGGGNGGGEGEEILDEDVPLAAAPQTGDSSLILLCISLISLGGFFLLKKKED